MQKLRVSSEEEGMAENIFTGIFTRLMEAVHVELSDETVDIPMSEELGKDVVLKLIDLLDGELTAVGHPVDDGLVFFVLQDLKALLDEVRHRSITALTRHVLLISNFYILNLKQ